MGRIIPEAKKKKDSDTNISSVTLCTTNPKWTGLGSKTGLQVRSRKINRIVHTVTNHL